MNPILVTALGAAVAFLFGFFATAASTKALIALQAREPFRTANWGLAVNAMNGAALLLIILTQNLPAFVAELAGCYIADYFVVRHERNKRNHHD